MKTDIKKCSKCKKEIPKQKAGSCTTGYAKDKDDNIVCYACCAIEDKQYMKDHKKITLYLTMPPEGLYNGKSKVTNWPGSFKVICHGFSKGHHNIAGVRYDVWFRFNGYIWWGVQYGDNTQICHCKQTKEKALFELSCKTCSAVWRGTTELETEEKAEQSPCLCRIKAKTLSNAELVEQLEKSGGLGNTTKENALDTLDK